MTCVGLFPRIAPVAERRFPREKYRRQLRAMELELEEWAGYYAKMVTNETPEWLQERAQDRYAQLLDIAHTVARARYDLDVLPRLS